MQRAPAQPRRPPPAGVAWPAGAAALAGAGSLARPPPALCVTAADEAHDCEGPDTALPR